MNLMPVHLKMNSKTSPPPLNFFIKTRYYYKYSMILINFIIMTQYTQIYELARYKNAKQKKQFEWPPLRLQRTLPDSDYLKYIRVARQWLKRVHGWSQTDQDMLLFLYSERFFNIAKFRKYENIFSWKKTRFQDLLDRDLIIAWRKPSNKGCGVYELSASSKRIITLFYQLLEGKRNFSAEARDNKMFDKKVQNFSDKVYALQMIEIAEENMNGGKVYMAKRMDDRLRKKRYRTPKPKTVKNKKSVDS
jgi:hypothetical protein